LSPSSGLSCRIRADSRVLQICVPREPRALLSAPVPESRRKATMAEGQLAYFNSMDNSPERELVHEQRSCQHDTMQKNQAGSWKHTVKLLPARAGPCTPEHQPDVKKTVHVHAMENRRSYTAANLWYACPFWKSGIRDPRSEVPIQSRSSLRTRHVRPAHSVRTYSRERHPQERAIEACPCTLTRSVFAAPAHGEVIDPGWLS